MPGLDFESGLRSVYDDTEVRTMGELVLGSRCLDLYVVHNGKELDFLKSQTGSSGSAQPINSPIHPHRPTKLTPRKSSRLTKESGEVSDSML